MSDQSGRVSSPPLPPHMAQPYSEEHFIVFAYEKPPGWWRRVETYRDLAGAQQVADAYNEDGRAVMVCRQVVNYGPFEPVTGASGV